MTGKHRRSVNFHSIDELSRSDAKEIRRKRGKRPMVDMAWRTHQLVDAGGSGSGRWVMDPKKLLSDKVDRSQWAEIYGSDDQDPRSHPDQPGNSDQSDDRDRILPSYQLLNSVSGFESEEETCKIYNFPPSGKSSSQLIAGNCRKTGNDRRIQDNANQFALDEYCEYDLTGSDHSSNYSTRKDSKKRVRPNRVPFCEEHILCLQRYFELANGYATRELVSKIATELNLPNSKVRVWFQNQRAKNQREKARLVSKETSASYLIGIGNDLMQKECRLNDSDLSGVSDGDQPDEQNLVDDDRDQTSSSNSSALSNISNNSFPASKRKKNSTSLHLPVNQEIDQFMKIADVIYGFAT